MGKEEVRIERGRDTLVLGKFTAIVSRERSSRPRPDSEPKKLVSLLMYRWGAHHT